MKIMLCHNPDAGTGDPGGSLLQRTLEDGAHEVVYQSTDEEIVLDPSAGRVVVAGGDGTAGKVFRRLADQPRVPVLLLPMGSANDIARSLGLGMDWREIVRQQDRLAPRPFYYGRVASEGVEDMFFESVGVGVFAELLHKLCREKDWAEDHAGLQEGFGRDFAALAEVAAEIPALEVNVSSAGSEIHERVLWVEVMNIEWIGPHLNFGNPSSAQDERSFSMVWIRESQREELVDWLRAKSKGQDPPFPASQWHTLEGEIQLSWPGGRYHVDDALKEHGSLIHLERVTKPLMILR